MYTLNGTPEPSCTLLALRPRFLRAGMKRAMLEVVCAGVVRKAEDVDRYIRCTLLFAMNSFEVCCLVPGQAAG